MSSTKITHDLLLFIYLVGVVGIFCQLKNIILYFSEKVKKIDNSSAACYVTRLLALFVVVMIIIPGFNLFCAITASYNLNKNKGETET